MPYVRTFRHLSVLVLTLFAALAAAQSDGAAIYATNCAGCHQADGAGLPGVFPPLAGHVGDLYAAEEGPRHLANVLLFGMQGAITVDGAEYAGVMPGWFQFSDDDVAAVLDHLMTAWGDADELDAYVPISAEDVAQARRGGLSPQGVYDRRPDLGGADDGAEAVELPLATVSQAQIDRIQATYERLCVECHGESFDGGLIGGPPLVGGAFLNKWGGRAVDALFLYTQAQMPQGGPGSLSAQQYADLVALILSVNGHPVGDADLAPDLEALSGVGIRTP
jgi:mono/diheme cytochrome c family protein